MNTKDHALDLALEALSTAHLVVEDDMLADEIANAITAIKQALAKDALYKLAEESCTSGLRLDDWDKIGCVNHDCDKCKAVQEPVALDVTLDGEEAKLLRDILGDDRDELSPVRLLVGKGHSGHGLYAAHAEYQEEGAVLLAATPPAAQRQWVWLTDKDISDTATTHPMTWVNLNAVENRTLFARILEAKLKEKNT
jgi:hypothetical protein